MAPSVRYARVDDPDVKLPPLPLTMHSRTGTGAYGVRSVSTIAGEASHL